MRRVAALVLGATCIFATGLLLAACGSGSSTSGERTNALTGTLTGIDVTLTRETGASEPETQTLETTVPITITETSEAETVTTVSTVVETTRVEIVAPPVTTEAATTAEATTTTSSVNPAAAAAAGAALASGNAEESDQTDWGWIAFAILAAAVLVGLGVWWWRSRQAKPPLAPS